MIIACNYALLYNYSVIQLIINIILCVIMIGFNILVRPYSATYLKITQSVTCIIMFALYMIAIVLVLDQHTNKIDLELH
jgi:hypothetical protein